MSTTATTPRRPGPFQGHLAHRSPQAQPDRRSTHLADLASPGNNLEKLKGNLAGWYSVRINDQWRILFAFEKAQASGVRIADYH